MLLLFDLDFLLCVFARDFQLESRAKTQSRQEGGKLTLLLVSRLSL
jgi:hypothetical protein